MKRSCKSGTKHSALAITARHLAAALSLAPLSVDPSTSMATTAAQISFDFVSQPSGLSADFAPRDGIAPRFLNVTTIDKMQLGGDLWQPPSKRADDTTIVVMIHGSGSSYRKPPQSALGSRLAAAGYASLAIDTRQHDAGINTDNLFDIRKDIEAAVMTAKALGYRKIVIQGHSLGTVQVQFFAATNWDPDIKAVILLGAFGNLPWKTRAIIIHDDETYKRLARASLDSLHAGTAGRSLSAEMPYREGRVTPVTAQHFLTYRWDASSAADNTFWVRKVPYPVLVLRDQSDGAVLPFEPYMILDAAHDEGSLNKSIDFVLLPDKSPTSEKGHLFEGNENALAAALVDWLKKQGL